MVKDGANLEGPAAATVARAIAGWTSKIVTASIASWFLLWLMAGDSIAYLGYVNALGFLFGAVSLIAALMLLALRSWIWASVAGTLAAFLLYMGSGFNMSAGNHPPSASSIRIVSASLRGLNKDMGSAAARLSTYNASIIAVQEVSDPAALTAALTKQTGKKWNIVIDGQYALLSTYKVSAPAVIATREPVQYWSAAQVDLGSRTIILWNIHAPKAFTRPVENSGYFASLLDAIRAEKPDLIVGDFNATPWNYGYRLVAKEMTSAHDAKGFGPGNSFPSVSRQAGLLGAFSRIDHIFVARKHRVSNAFTGRASAGADHHPVIADVDFEG